MNNQGYNNNQQGQAFNNNNYTNNNNNQNQGYNNNNNNNYPQGQQNPGNEVLIVHGRGNCLNCRTGTMSPAKNCTIWTVIVALCCVCGLCCDCAWGKGSVCLSCGYAT